MEGVAESAVKTIKVKAKEDGTEASRSGSQPRTAILPLFCKDLVHQNPPGNGAGASPDQSA